MIGTIKQEAAAARKAWKGYGVGTIAWFFHHKKLCEPIPEPPLQRIKFILSDKPQAQQAIRLHCFRPIKGKLPQDVTKARQAYVEAEQAYNKAINKHLPSLTKLIRKEIPDCPWDGETLFSK